MVVITKSDIINGIKASSEYESKILGKTISIRPLTDGEYNQIEAIKKDMGKVKANVAMTQGGEIDLDATAARAKREKALKESGMEIDLDLKKTEEMKYKADCMAAAYGLSIEGIITPDDIKQGPAGLAHEISIEVYRISRLTDPESLGDDVESFPNKQ